MKKLIVICLLFLVAAVTKVSAQGFTKVGPGTLVLSSVKLKEGENRVPVNGKIWLNIKIPMRPNGRTIVEFVDSTGKIVIMTQTNGGTNGAPKPECKSTLPDECFSTPDKNIGLCLCKPGNISNGEGTFSITLVAVKAKASNRSPDDPLFWTF